MMIGRVTLMSRIVGSIPKMMLAVCTLGMCHDLKSPVIDIPAAAPICGEYAQQKFDVALIPGLGLTSALLNSRIWQKLNF